MKLSKILPICLIAVTCSCGGGGGGSDYSAPKSFAGVWTGDMFATSNTCDFVRWTSGPVIHKVDQDGTRVVLNIPSQATVYEGTTDGTTGFTVSQEVVNQPVGNGVSCRLIVAMRYSAEDEKTALVDNVQRYECSSGSAKSTCEFKATGELTRQ